MSSNDIQSNNNNVRNKDIASMDDQMSKTSRDKPLSSQSVCVKSTNILTIVSNNELTTKLAKSGLSGKAAAAAIVSAKNRTKYSFETCPFIRNRQKNRLIKKLKTILKEYSSKFNQQAVGLIATPQNATYKVFGTQPLESIIKNLKSKVLIDLESALNKQTPPILQKDTTLFELPPLLIDGIPTPVDKMTQKQLRTLIPLMLKFSTGRVKPGWSNERLKPIWWPVDVPWANIRMDTRRDKKKTKLTWTNALRKIVINCYKYHEREDLLPVSIKGKSEESDTTDVGKKMSPNNPYITLPDGTKAWISGTTSIASEFDLIVNDGNISQTRDDINGWFVEDMQDVDKNNVLKEARISDDGYLSLTVEKNFFVEENGIITIPIPESLYESIATISQIQSND